MANPNAANLRAYTNRRQNLGIKYLDIFTRKTPADTVAKIEQIAFVTAF